MAVDVTVEADETAITTGSSLALFNHFSGLLARDQWLRVVYCLGLDGLGVKPRRARNTQVPGRRFEEGKRLRRTRNNNN
jgi:hypothetical protein